MTSKKCLGDGRSPARLREAETINKRRSAGRRVIAILSLEPHRDALPTHQHVGGHDSAYLSRSRPSSSSASEWSSVHFLLIADCMEEPGKNPVGVGVPVFGQDQLDLPAKRFQQTRPHQIAFQ